MTTEYEYSILPPVDPDNPSHYVDKQKMRQALLDYRDACREAEANGKDIPIVPNYLGECFLKIARGLGMKHNFRNYSFLDEMVSDAVLTCLKYIRAYDPERISEATGKPTSAFSYFTQACWYSFLNRIKLEEKETVTKHALLLETDLETFSTQVEDDGEFKVNLVEYLNSIGPLPKTKEKLKVEKKKKSSGGLEDFT